MNSEEFIKRFIKGKKPGDYDEYNATNPFAKERAQAWKDRIGQVLFHWHRGYSTVLVRMLADIATAPIGITGEQTEKRIVGWFYRRNARRIYDEKRMAIRVLGLLKDQYAFDVLFRLALEKNVEKENAISPHDIGLDPVCEPGSCGLWGSADTVIAEEAFNALVYNSDQRITILKLLKILEEKSEGVSTAVAILAKISYLNVTYGFHKELEEDHPMLDDNERATAQESPALAEEFFGAETARRIERAAGTIVTDGSMDSMARIEALYLLFNIRGIYSVGHLMRAARSGDKDLMDYALHRLIILGDPHGLKAVQEARYQYLALREGFESEEFAKIGTQKGHSEDEIKEIRALAIADTDKHISRAVSVRSAIRALVCKALDPQNAHSYSQDGNDSLMPRSEIPQALYRAFVRVSMLGFNRNINYNPDDMRTIVRALKQKQRESRKAQPVAAK